MTMIFNLRDHVKASDNRGEIGEGWVIGRAFDDPMRYDVVIDGDVYRNLPAAVLSHAE